MAKVFANGSAVDVDLPCRLTDMLKRFGLKPTQVVVELNGNVVARNSVEQLELQDGDRLEVIVPVAGG